MAGRNQLSTSPYLSNDPAPALGRGLGLLALLEKEGPSTLQHMAELSGLPKSTTLRLLTSLSLAGLVKRELRSLRFIAMARLVPSIATHEPLRQGARDTLIDLAHQSRQTVELHAYLSDAMPLPLTMIDRCEPKGVVVRVHARIGFQRSLPELDALTLITLAFGDQPRRRMKHFHWHLGQKQRLAAEQVNAHISQARKAGVANDLGVNRHGVRRYASPIFSHNRKLLAILAIAQYVTPLNPQPNARLKQMVHRRAILLTQAGYSPDPSTSS